MENVISITDITFKYEETGSMVLDHVSLDIEKGSFTAILGHNGSGKSTLAMMMNSLLVPSGGSVSVFGARTDSEDFTWSARSRVGMVFQNPDNQLVSSVVEDDVAFGPENLGVPSGEIRRRVDKALRDVGMYEFRKKGPHLLSGGQKQRVAIAGVLAMNSDVIVLDEPTAMLDPDGRGEIMAVIKDLHRSGKTVILITHFMEEAAEADRIVVMENGRIALDGSPAEIFGNGGKSVFSIELPFAARISGKLRADGYPVPGDIVTEDALFDYLCSLK